MERTPFLNQNSSTPLYIQLYDYFRRQIEEKSIAPNSKLPSIRQLSLHLKVSRNTVETAYQQLIAEGYVESKPKSGYQVVEIDSFYNRPKIKTIDTVMNPIPKQDSLIDFQYGDIEVDRFPMREWRRSLVEAIDFTNSNLFTYGEKQGHFGLRNEIAKYLYQARGVECEADEIVLCAGTQQAILLLSQLLDLGNQKVAMENPGYDGVRAVFQMLKCQLIPIPLESDGVDLSEVEKSQAKALYLTPSHQFPLGMVLSISKRLKLLQWANNENSYLIEDDYDSEFRYQGQPIPSLKSLDQQDRVIYLGTFSKAFLPATRVSYIVLPKALITRYRDHFSFLHQSVSPLIQEALFHFMKNGHFVKHIRKMRKIYQLKHRKLIESIDKYIGNHVTVIGQKAGLHLLIKVNGINEKILIEKAAKSGIKVYPTDSFWLEKDNKNLNLVMIGYGGLSETEIEEGIKTLKLAWFG
ncbi:MAG TPA: PLP-dependent aminotransferase family protein [Pseudoneobacillus sp.]|nr:PLP-dependent aminotransferase family protein [Pseudoneobacillus sp.]